MNENQTQGRQTPSPNSLPRYISWLTIVLAILTVVSFFAVSDQGRNYVTHMGGGWAVMEGTTGSMPPVVMDVTTVRDMGAPEVSSSIYYPYPYPNTEVPIGDTREFLKIYYNASIKTREVQDLTRRVATTVRGYGGRIDQESSSIKYGSVSFAIPQSKYEAFRTELEGFVGKRFINVNISSNNLLPQKVSIEEQKTQADKALADHQAMRQKIVNAHASAVKSLQAKIDADEQKLISLRAQISTPEIQAEIQSVSNDLSSLNQQLINENASYTDQINNADQNIKYTKDWQEAILKQDTTFLENVATVTGTISLQWISLWDIALLYLPGYWIPTIFAALTILSFTRDRKRRNLLPLS